MVLELSFLLSALSKLHVMQRFFYFRCTTRNFVDKMLLYELVEREAGQNGGLNVGAEQT